jgi:Tfp pilus assembly protein FimT
VGGKNATASIRGVRDERGVTLAEVTTAMVLFAALTLSAVPVLPRLLAAYQLRGATQYVYSELQRARVAAVTENNRYQFRVVDGSPYFVVHDDENGDDVENDGGDTVTTRSLELDSPGVTLSGDGAVSFAPNGAARTPRRIYLRGVSGDMSVIAVSAGGRIRIE